jgi:hypothetical protein
MALILAGQKARSADLLEDVDKPARCNQKLQLRTIHPLDFGDVRLRAQESGFVSVSTDGILLRSDNVLVRHDPTAALVDVCGKPNQDVVIVLKTPEVLVQAHLGDPAAKHVNRFVIKGMGMKLESKGGERWEGKLGSSGRASLLMGATLAFQPNGVQGPFVSSIALSVLEATSVDVPITGHSEFAMEVNCPISLNFGAISIPHMNPPGTVVVAATLAGGVTSPFLVTGNQRARCDVTNVTKQADVVISGGNGIWNPHIRQLTGAKLLKDRNALAVVIEIDKTSVGGPGIASPLVPIYIGGTLDVPANFTGFGVYSRTFTITVTE